MPLDAFFGAMAAFLAGTCDAEALTRVLSPSSSGVARLSLYPELVRRQRRDVLDSLFAPVRSACASLGPGLWDAMTREYAQVHPPRHWEPNHFGARFSDFLADKRLADPSLPEYFEELADYQFVRFLAGVSDALEADEPALERGLFVRRYEHDIAAYVEQIEGKPFGTSPPPVRQATTLIIGWSRITHRVITLRGSRQSVIAIARRAGQDTSHVLDPAALHQATEQLVTLGILEKEPHA